MSLLCGHPDGCVDDLASWWTGAAGSVVWDLREWLADEEGVAW